jgi:hypothetical protein
VLQGGVASANGSRGNGLPDIIAQDFTNQLFLFLNQGKKKFTAKNINPGLGLGDGTFLKLNGYKVEDSFTSCDLYAADFNKDGKPDLVGVNTQLPSPVTVISGTPPDLSLLNFYLYDFNLVRSNSLQ